MVSLLDIAPSTACGAVEVNGKKIAVRGLGAADVASLASRFPELIGVILGQSSAGGNVGAILINQAGNVFAPIIAAGCGYLDNEEQERAAGRLPLEDQVKLVMMILELSFPNGFSFLSNALERLARLMRGEAKPVEKVRLKKSPSPSPGLSDLDSRQIM